MCHTRAVRLAVLAVLGLVALFPAALDAAAPRPSLRIVDRDPLTLTGRTFRAHELVRVSVQSGKSKTLTRKVRADAAGRFRIAVAGVKLDRCSGDLEVTAAGGRGSSVSFSLRRLDCNDRADD